VTSSESESATAEPREAAETATKAVRQKAEDNRAEDNRAEASLEMGAP